MAQINKANEYFNTVAYSGTGVNPTSITSVGFEPDLLWIKSRSDAFSHLLFDSVRGVDKRLISNSTSAETTESTISSFDTNGWTMDSDTANNGSGKTYVAWNWLAGGTASSNTDGSITSTVSASTTSGFSVVSFTGNGVTGATVGHSLGVKPAMIILKIRSNASTNWGVYHQSLGATKYLTLNLNNGSTTSNTRWNDVEPTSSVFSLGSSGDVNTSSATIIAYCFAEKKGFSKFGSYVGNGNADGSYIHLGFKPAFIMLKNTTNAREWNMQDNKRIGYNPNNYGLFPHNDDAEQTGFERVDFLSNGFKLKTNSEHWNESGDTYIYMAFAENPLVGTNGIPATAR